MAATPLPLLWLEITGRCQLECVHCYAASGPTGTHGVMTLRDWAGVLEQAADLHVGMVQFIGGEPTLHPALPDLIVCARALALEIEVFSNLVHVSPALWDVFGQPGVRLATSYYSPDASQHERITGRAGSHGRTRANVREALRRGIPLRVGIIGVSDDQQVEEAAAELEALGATDVGVDRLRQVGRGIREVEASVEQLCGKCASGSLAVAPSGDVAVCVRPLASARQRT